MRVIYFVGYVTNKYEFHAKDKHKNLSVELLDINKKISSATSSV